MRLIGVIAALLLVVGCTTSADRADQPTSEFGYLSLHWEAAGPSNDVRWCDLLDSGQQVALDPAVVLETGDFTAARTAHDEKSDTYFVEMVMTTEGRNRMKELSSRNLGRRLAIVIENEVVALATVSRPIDSDALNLPPMPNALTAEKVAGQINRAIEGM